MNQAGSSMSSERTVSGSNGNPRSLGEIVGGKRRG
jgi:hypothetical protein